MSKPVARLSILALLSLFLLSAALAHHDVIESPAVKYTMLAVHIVELVLAMFICFMALKFFAITRPTSMFLIIYIAGGFFIIGSLIHLLPYVLEPYGLHMSFASVYFGGRIALIGMLLSFGAALHYINRQMRKPQ